MWAMCFWLIKKGMAHIYDIIILGVHAVMKVQVLHVANYLSVPL